MFLVYTLLLHILSTSLWEKLVRIKQRTMLEEKESLLMRLETVSYTHLTLPTSDLV
mgnify:CR=1 FL=1